MMKPNWKIMQGDVREQLALIPEKSVQCVITSPPYFGLRDYGIDGQIGLEKMPEEYVKNLVEVFRGVWKVLRDNGVVWLNLGDSYAGGGGVNGIPSDWNSISTKNRDKHPNKNDPERNAKAIGYKPKDLMMIPFLVAGALQRDGWYLRSIIPWLKNSAMPESVIDRPTSAIEYFFLLSKSQKYFYDIEAVRMQGSIPAGTRAAKGSEERTLQFNVNARPPEYKIYSGTRNRRDSDWFMDSLRDILNGENGTLLHDEEGSPTAVFCNPQPYKEAHFATFSPRLITPMILAGTSPRACERCGAPWERVRERKGKTSREWQKIKGYDMKMGKQGKSIAGSKPPDPIYITTSWQPTCACENEGKGRCTVLDPFAGSGTTLEAARLQNRDSIGIELSKEYCKLIEKRMRKFKLSLF